MFSRSNHSHVEHCKMLQCQCPHLLLGHSSLGRSEGVFNVTAKPAYDLAGVAQRQPRFGRACERAACAFWAPSLLPSPGRHLCARALRSHARSGPWGPDGPSVAWPRSLPPCPSWRPRACLHWEGAAQAVLAFLEEPCSAPAPAPLPAAVGGRELLGLGGRRGCTRAQLQHQECKRPARLYPWRDSQALVHPSFLGDEGSTVPWGCCGRGRLKALLPACPCLPRGEQASFQAGPGLTSGICSPASPSRGEGRPLAGEIAQTFLA